MSFAEYQYVNGYRKGNVAAGYFWQEGRFDKIRAYIFPPTFAVCSLATVAVQLFAFGRGVGYAVWYNNATLFIAAFSVFALVPRMKPATVGAAVKNLAVCSFGIYLVHFPITMLLLRYIIKSDYLSVRVAVVFAATLAASWGTVRVLSKIKRDGKALFYIK